MTAKKNSTQYQPCKRCQAGLKPRSLEDVGCGACVGMQYPSRVRTPGQLRSLNALNK